MSTYVPQWVGQLDGSRYAGLNCDPAIGAIALDRETLGKHRTTGSAVRALTHDTSGGTNQQQIADALHAGWGVDIRVRDPIAQSSAFTLLDEGCGMMLAGSSAATRGTKWQASETFGGNHQWFDNERRKNSQVSGGYEHRIYDPLGDARRPGIADFRHGGLWIPEAIVLSFAKRLNLAKDQANDYSPLGPGHFYSAFTHDTEPHLVLRFHGHAIVPPVSKVIRVPKGHRANVRTGPNTRYRIASTLPNGATFHCYQQTWAGQLLNGSKHWYGNLDGTRWLHETAF